MALPLEVSNALYGAWRLARLDRGGMVFFAHGEAAFWRSFRAAIIAYPVYLILRLYPIYLALAAKDPSDADWESVDWLRIGLVQTIGYVIVWVAFPLVMLPVTRRLGREARWLDFIIVYNWSQTLQYGLFLAVTILAQSSFLPAPVVMGLLKAAFVAALLYEWFIAYVALEITLQAAIIVVVVDFVLGLLLDLAVDLLR